MTSEFVSLWLNLNLIGWHIFYIFVYPSVRMQQFVIIIKHKLCSITLRLSDPYCQTLNVRFHNGSFRYDSFQSGSLVSVIIMTGFRQHLNWTTKMCDHVILLSYSGRNVHSMSVPCPFGCPVPLIQIWFWLWKIIQVVEIMTSREMCV